MNIAMAICMICMGWKQRPSTNIQTLLVCGKRFHFCLLQNFELPPQYIQKLKTFWECYPAPHFVWLILAQCSYCSGEGFHLYPIMHWTESYMQFSGLFFKSFNIVLCIGSPGGNPEQDPNQDPNKILTRS